jgi:hypothetical protein
MKRRELLQAAGAGILLDWSALGVSTAHEDAVPVDAFERFRTGICTGLSPTGPPLAHGGSDCTVSTQAPAGTLLEPAVTRDATAHGSLVGPDAMVSVGLDVGSGIETSLREQGYGPIEWPEGRPPGHRSALFERRDRGRQRLATRIEETVVIGSGQSLHPTASLVRTAVGTRGSRQAAESPGSGALATVLDQLGPGLAVAVDTTGPPADLDPSEPRRVGTRIGVTEGSGELRFLAQFASEAAARRALARGAVPGPDGAGFETATQAGRHVYRDVPVDLDAVIQARR